MANTIGTSTLSEVWRIKYFKSMLEVALRNRLVAEDVCKVERGNGRYVSNPYMTQPTAAIAAIAGTYAVSTATTTDEKLTVSDQVTYAIHLFEFEDTLARVDLYSSFIDEMTAAVATVVDKFVLNKILDGAGESYTTPEGGFTTAGNINEIFSELLSKVAGYTEEGMPFIVLENTDLPGLIQAGATNGFNFADATLNNGFNGNYMGVDVYIIRTGTFATDTIGTLSATNSGHRLFGIKNTAVYATPRNIQYDEKKVTLKTGKELSVWANIGAVVWTPKEDLLVDITLA